MQAVHVLVAGMEGPNRTNLLKPRACLSALLREALFLVQVLYHHDLACFGCVALTCVSTRCESSDKALCSGREGS